MYNPSLVTSPIAWQFLQVFYPVILLYMIAAFLQGGPAVSMGMLNNVRTYLFIRVSQDAYRFALTLKSGTDPLFSGSCAYL